MTEISTGGQESEATLLDEAQAEIARSLADEFAEQAAEQTVAEIVEKTIGALMLKGFIGRGALRIGSHYRFGNLRPHPESPITEESFRWLDETIAEVNNDLDIGNTERFYALSPSRKGDPVISVNRQEGSNGLRIIEGSVESKEGTWRLMLRNDAGTVRDPKQVAGTRINYDSRGNPSERVAASDQDVVDLEELVAQRLAQNRFVKKEALFRVHL